MDELRVQVDSLEARTQALVQHRQKRIGTGTLLKERVLADFAELTIAEAEEIAVVTLSENYPFG